jgi:hypothetical protein
MKNGGLACLQNKRKAHEVKKYLESIEEVKTL